MKFLTILFIGALCTAAAVVKRERKGSDLRDKARTVRETLDLEKGKAATEHILSLIYNRYEMFNETKLGLYLIMPFLNINEHAWDMMKYKYALKMLTGEDFLAIFGGSSVTAGHDNFLNESYPMVYERRMKGPLEALGIELKVHNIAMGGVGCFPQNLCYESQGGDNPDLVSWEHSYFCKYGQEKAMSAMTAVRSNRHAVYMDQASGALSINYCEPVRQNLPSKNYNDNPLYSDEFWTPASAGLKEWKPTFDDVVKYRTFSAKHSSTGSYFPQQVGSQITGAWNIMPGCTLPIDNTSKCMQAIVASTFCSELRFINKETGRFHVTGGGAAHHPASGIHLLRAESIVWYHALILLDAIYMVEKGFERGETAEKQVKEYKRVLDALAPPLALDPPPKECEGYHCQYKLECYNDYRPRWNDRLSLRQQLVIQQGNWTWLNNSLNWWQIRGQYLDTGADFRCDHDACEELSIIVRVSTVKEVLLVGSFAGATFYVDANVAPEKYKNYKRPVNLAPWTDVDIAPKSFNTAKLKNLPAGEHVVTLGPSAHVSLSHVMVWI